MEEERDLLGLDLDRLEEDDDDLLLLRLSRLSELLLLRLRESSLGERLLDLPVGLPARKDLHAKLIVIIRLILSYHVSAQSRNAMNETWSSSLTRDFCLTTQASIHAIAIFGEI